MKKYLTALLLVFFLSVSHAQVELNDFGRIILNTYLPEKMELPSGAKKLLQNKLSQITSNNGIGGSKANPRFIITANVNVGTKDIIPGPPQMIAQNIDLTLYIGDALTNTVFTNTSISLKGVGTNQDKALINAFKKINPKNKKVVAFLEEGKNEIINYFNTQCDFILKDAQTLVKQEKYDEAIYQLSLIPEVSQECYFKSLDNLASIYQKKVDAECQEKMAESKLIWAASQNPKAAEKVGVILSTIKSTASCHEDVDEFIKTISTKLKADEKTKWEFKMQEYQDDIALQKEQARRNNELDKIRLNAYREVALEYAKNRAMTTYDNINIR